MGRYGVRRQDMTGERVQVRRVVAEEEGERDGREGVGVGVVGGACENHVDQSAERKTREKVLDCGVPRRPSPGRGGSEESVVVVKISI